MKIGIISDSHDHHKNVLKAIEIFNRENINHIFHCGDIVSPFTAKAFANIKDLKFTAVFGNNDGEKLFLKQIINNFGGKIFEYNHTTELQNKKIIMTHTHHFIQDIVDSQNYDIVLYGHTHKIDIRRENKTLVINPGESTDWLTDNPNIVILDLDSMEYDLVSLK